MEQGTHAELMEKDGVYNKLVTTQEMDEAEELMRLQPKGQQQSSIQLTDQQAVNQQQTGHLQSAEQQQTDYQQAVNHQHTDQQSAEQQHTDQQYPTQRTDQRRVSIQEPADLPTEDPKGKRLQRQPSPKKGILKGRNQYFIQVGTVSDRLVDVMWGMLVVV